MKNRHNLTPRLLVWGLSLLLVFVVSISGCGSPKNTWTGESFKIVYDKNVFTEISSDNQTLNLTAKKDDKKIEVTVIGFHPFAVESEIIVYLQSAQVAFEDEFSRITNNSKEDNKQYGVSERRVSISGEMDGFDGVVTGMLRVMLSDDTLLHVKMIGDSSLVTENMQAVQEILGTAEILK